MMIFTRWLLYTNEIGVRQHQPLRALSLEIDLDPGMRSIALEIEHHAVAELRMPDPAAHAHVLRGRLFKGDRTPDEYRPRHLQARPNFLDQVGRQLTDEAGRLPIGIHAIETALLGIRDVKLAHRPSHAHVGETALLL